MDDITSIIQSTSQTLHADVFQDLGWGSFISDLGLHLKITDSRLEFLFFNDNHSIISKCVHQYIVCVSFISPIP